MADNYLERKYEQFIKGRPVIRKVNPSLDSLLSALPDEQDAEDSQYKVSRLQAEAAISSARRMGIGFSASFPDDNDPSVLKISCRSSYDLGAVTTAARLKLAELHLQTRLRLSDSGTDAVIEIFRKASR